MADKLFKVGEPIPFGYQAPNKQSELVVIAEIYLPNKQKDSSYPDVYMDEVEDTGTYIGEFTPDQQGNWQVICHLEDSSGQIVKGYSVGGHNIHSIGEKLVQVGNQIGSIASPPMMF